MTLPLSLRIVRKGHSELKRRASQAPCSPAASLEHIYQFFNHFDHLSACMLCLAGICCEHWGTFYKGQMAPSGSIVIQTEQILVVHGSHRMVLILQLATGLFAVLTLVQAYSNCSHFFSYFDINITQGPIQGYHMAKSFEYRDSIIAKDKENAIR